MKKLNLTSKAKQEILSFCTIELLDYVLNDFKSNGGIIIDINTDDLIWEIDNYLKESKIEPIEIMKVFSVFSEIGGMFVIDEKRLFYEGLIPNKDISKFSVDILDKYWTNHRLNGTCPVFDLGTISIPKIMDRFVCTPIDEHSFQIEKLIKGEYIPLKNEIYPSKELCQNRVNELNEDM